MSNSTNKPQVKIEFLNGQKLQVFLPITSPTGKVRVKDRNVFHEYGKPVSTRSEIVPTTAYIEWQIGYDLEKKTENLEKTSLKNCSFENYKGVLKMPYELAEILFYSKQLGLISNDEIKVVKSTIKNFSDEELLENCLNVWRSNPKLEVINGIEFQRMDVKYPLLVHKYKDYETVTEILVTEKQRAVGVQPMLYICVPVKYVCSSINGNFIDGRVAEKGESAIWIIGKEEAIFLLEVAKLFGLLSFAHRHDILEILNLLFPENN